MPGKSGFDGPCHRKPDVQEVSGPDTGCLMSADTTLTASDEGKTVVNHQGDKIGRIVEVDSGRAMVDPDPDVTDTIMSKLGWSDADEDAYPLQESHIETVTDDEIRLGSM